MISNNTTDAVFNNAEVSYRRALLAFSFGTLFFAYAFLQRVSPSVMTDELMRDFSVSATAIGTLSAFYFYAYAVVQVPVGALMDRFGPRKLMSISAILCAAATFAFALGDSLVTASISRALIGLTVAFAFVGTISIAGYWFKPRQFATLTGVLQATGMLGAIFGQAPLRIMIESIGWRLTSVALALLALLLGALLYVCVPERHATQAVSGSTLVASGSGGLRRILTNYQSWLCAAIGFGLMAPILAFAGLWAVPWLQAVQGYPAAQAAATTSIMFVGAALLAPLSGWLSDAAGRRKPVLLLGALLNMIGLGGLFLFTPDSKVVLWILMFIIGGGSASIVVCFGAIRECNDATYSNTATGMMNTFVICSGAVLQPLVGFLLDVDWDGQLMAGVPVYSAENYTFALSPLLISSVLCVVAVLFLRETHCKPVPLNVPSTP